MFDYTTTARNHGFSAALIELIYVRAEQRGLHIPFESKNLDRFWSELINLDMNGTLTAEGLHIHIEGDLRPADWIHQTKLLTPELARKAEAAIPVKGRDTILKSRLYNAKTNFPTWRSFDLMLDASETTFTLTMEDLSQ